MFHLIRYLLTSPRFFSVFLTVSRMYRLKSKDQITDPIAEAVDEALPDDPAFKTALANCIMNAKKNLGWGYYILGPTWIQGCLLRKGFSIGKDWLEKNI